MVLEPTVPIGFRRRTFDPGDALGAVKAEANVCGLAGILHFDGRTAELRQGESMARLLIHRGPDGVGFHQDGPLILAHRHLRIIDLSPRALQPMSNEDGTIWLIHNGEIYNFLELRPALESRGHVFRSSCDSELILHAYEEDGEDCVRQLNGMWAFALWDSRRRRLLVSRDRLGEKPLYYVLDSRAFLFASEIKALLALRPELAEPSLGEIAQFLAAGILDSGPQTFFRKVLQLPPGHNLLVEADGRTELRRYWAPPEPQDSVPSSPERAAHSFLELLEDAVRLRLRSDVPLGSCLSGGIDSSSLLALGSRLLNAKPIPTFSCVFEEPGFNERPYVEAMSRALPTVPYQVTPSPHFLESLPRIVWHQEVPFTGPGLYGQWCVMALARKRVKVLLCGQGADELLGGYFYYYPDHLGDLLRGAVRPAALWELLVALARISRRVPFDDTARLLREGIWRLQGRPREAGFKGGWFGHYLSEDLAREAQEFLGPPAANGAGFLSTLLHLDVIRTSLPMMLHSEDRNAMAHGIESRVPFMDHRLVEFCMRLPGNLRIQAGITKAPLRHAMNGSLPKAVAWRADKMGFGEPLALWLRQDAHREDVEEILLSPRARARGLLRMERVAQDLREHRSGRDRTVPLYRALTLELWFRNFVDGEGMARFGPSAGGEGGTTGLSQDFQDGKIGGEDLADPRGAAVAGGA